MNDYLPLRSTLIGLAISMAILVANSAAAQKGKGGGGSSPAVVFRVTRIENPLPDSPLYVRDLSGASEAVGYIRGPQERIPFVWSTNTGLVPLQMLLSEQDQQQWHLEIPEAINDTGQIVGFASVQGGDPNHNWAAFRLDLPDDWQNNWWLNDAADAALTILEEGVTNGWHTIQISNGGDVVISDGSVPTLYYYPPDSTGNSDGVNLNYPSVYAVGINSFGEIIVDTDQGYSRLTLNLEGGYSEYVFPAGDQLFAINDSGMIVGAHFESSGKYSSFPYLFRYTDQDGEVVMKDGNRTITDVRRPFAVMNEQGDVGLTGPAIHTAEGKYLMLNDLIHPDDAAGYQGHYVRGIASRINETGFPPVVVSNPNGTTNGYTLYDNYLLTPE